MGSVNWAGRAAADMGGLTILTILAVLALSTGISAQQCNPDNRDCSCKDTSYDICHTPPASQEMHVGSLQECIEGCDLFGGFGKCNFLLYFGDDIDENCKLISDSTLKEYLDACRVVGQPLKDINGQCIQGLQADACSFIGCDTGCHTCDSTEACGMYTETECEKLGSPGETSNQIPDYTTCLSLCTSQQQSNPFTYVVYDKEAQECICYPDGLRSCQIIAVPFGLNINQVDRCGGCTDDNDCKPPRPVCSGVSGYCEECVSNTDCPSTKPFCNNNICEEDKCSTCAPPTPACDSNGECVECVSDSDCSDPTKPSCDLSENVCKTGCTTDSDCDADDYCQCTTHSTDECSSGHCVLGCRNVGDMCNVNSVLTGKCNGDHECVQSGGAVLTKIILGTKDCTGCNGVKEPGVAGATIMMKTDAVTGDHTCSTNILDHTHDVDYPNSGTHDFEDYATLGPCFMFDLTEQIMEFSVSWTGPGTWTPDKFILVRENESTWPFCCFNDGGLTVSEGQSQTFTCEAASGEWSSGLKCEK